MVALACSTDTLSKSIGKGHVSIHVSSDTDRSSSLNGWSSSSPVGKQACMMFASRKKTQTMFDSWAYEADVSTSRNVKVTPAHRPQTAAGNQQRETTANDCSGRPPLPEFGRNFTSRPLYHENLVRRSCLEHKHHSLETHHEDGLPELLVLKFVPPSKPYPRPNQARAHEPRKAVSRSIAAIL